MPPAAESQLRVLPGPIDAWIDDRVTYHAAVSKDLTRRQRQLNWLTVMLFGVGALVALFHSTSVLEAPSGPDVWGYLSVVIPAAGAAVAGYGGQREYGPLAERSQLTVNRLSGLRQKIADLGDSSQGQRETQRAVGRDQQALDIARETARELLADGSALRHPEGSTVDKTQKGDRVECSVFAPPTVLPGSTFLIQVFAHISDRTREAIRRAKEFDPDSVRLAIKTLESSVSRGTKLNFCLTIPGLRVDDPVQRMVWWGTTEAVQFGVSVPEQHRLGKVVGTITVSQDWVPTPRT